MKLKNSNCNENLKTQIVTKLKNSKCYKTQKLKLCQNSNCEKKLKNSKCDQTQVVTNGTTQIRKRLSLNCERKKT